MKNKGKHDRNDNKRPMYEGLGRALNLGFAIAACVIISVLAGRFLDGQFGCEPWFTLLFSFLGVFMAGKTVYDAATRK